MTVKSLFLFPVFLCITLFTACKKSSPDIYYVKATVNGKTFYSSSFLYSYNVKDSILTIAEGNINAMPPYPNMAISILNFTGPGTYYVSSVTHILIDSNYVINTVYGSVTITAASPNVTGTFSFTCGDSTKVTEGSFVAKQAALL